MNRSKVFAVLFFSAVTLGTAAVVWACGGEYYITSLLQSGDRSVTERPATRFKVSIEKLLPEKKWDAVTANAHSYDNPPETESATACITLLEQALSGDKNSGDAADAVTRAVRDYANIRAAMVNDFFDRTRDTKRMAVTPAYKPVLQRSEDADLRVSWERVTMTPELLTAARKQLDENLFADDVTIPAEFLFYLEGAVAWHKEDFDAARTAWKKVLALPEAERRHQEIFAAYMLGMDAYRRSRVAADDVTFGELISEARSHFQSVREIATKNKIDPCGLACASLGQEARTYLGDGGGAPVVADFSKAASLYLEQAAANDGGGVYSLQIVLRRLANLGDKEWRAIAKDPVLRPLMSAFILSDGGHQRFQPSTAQARKWIHALESAGDVSDAEAVQLAYMCYQNGDYISCARWVQRVPADNPIAGWLTARLLLREGKSADAAAILSKTVDELSLKKFLQSPDSEKNYVPVSPWRYDWELLLQETGGPSLNSRIVAEQGVLAMTTKDYTGALDAFLHSDLTADAAYVAEYVLSANELKTYVDKVTVTESKESPEGIGFVRHILAKRLLRERRWQESRAYFPEAVHETFDQYVAHIQQGYNTALDFEKRAAGFWNAAVLVRENGGALFLAAVGPHWSYDSGWNDYKAPLRGGVSDAQPLTKPTADEIARVRSRYIGKADRDVRYRAAEFAWIAASLLPNNDERTSRILATAGAWLKYREPRAAEPFYKMLVIRCPDTPLGKAADRLHWFPPEVTGAVTGVWDDAPVVKKDKDGNAVTEPVSSVELSTEDAPKDE